MLLVGKESLVCFFLETVATREIRFCNTPSATSGKRFFL